MIHKRRHVVACVLLALSLSGCARLMKGVSDPLSPDEAKRQATDAATEIVTITGITPIEGQSTLYLDACGDDGLFPVPYRGSAYVSYPLAPDKATAWENITRYVRALEAAGWTVLPPDYSQNPPNTVKKGGVMVSFEPRWKGDGTANLITVLGECRDVTTTKDTRPPGEPFTP